MEVADILEMFDVKFKDEGSLPKREKAGLGLHVCKCVKAIVKTNDKGVPRLSMTFVTDDEKVCYSGLPLDKYFYITQKILKTIGITVYARKDVLSYLDKLTDNKIVWCIENKKGTGDGFFSNIVSVESDTPSVEQSLEKLDSLDSIKVPF